MPSKFQSCCCVGSSNLKGGAVLQPELFPPSLASIPSSFARLNSTCRLPQSFRPGTPCKYVIRTGFFTHEFTRSSLTLYLLCHVHTSRIATKPLLIVRFLRLVLTTTLMNHPIATRHSNPKNHFFATSTRSRDLNLQLPRLPLQGQPPLLQRRSLPLPQMVYYTPQRDVCLGQPPWSEHPRPR